MNQQELLQLIGMVLETPGYIMAILEMTDTFMYHLMEEDPLLPKGDLGEKQSIEELEKLM